MKLVEFLVLAFADQTEHDYNDWPEDVVASREHNSEVTFEGWEYNYKSPYGYGEWEATVSFDVDGKLPYLEDYEAGEEVTREEFFEFIEEHPNFIAEIEAKRKENMGKIAELNKIAYDAVEHAMKLSSEAGIPYTCSMPAGVADLDENSDWNSSRC